MLQPFKHTIPFLIILIGCIIIVFSYFLEYQQAIKEKNIKLAQEQSKNREYGNLLKSSNEILLKTNELLKKQINSFSSSGDEAALQKDIEAANTGSNAVHNTQYLDSFKNIAMPQLFLSCENNNLIYLKVVDTKNKVENVKVNFIEIDMTSGTIINAGNVFKKLKNTNGVVVNLSNCLQCVCAKNSWVNKETSESKLYKYSVLWPTGYYSGEFTTVVNSNGYLKIMNNVINTGSKNIDLEKAVLVNNNYTKVSKDNGAL